MTLTDEEIVAVDGEESVAPRFWYDAQPPASRQLAVTVAARGLVARGWAIADPTATRLDDLALEPVGPLLAVLGLRRPASFIVLAEQRLETETRARVYYLHDEDDMALEEAVNSGGLHRFSTLPTRAAVSELAAWCDPFDTPPPPRAWELSLGSTSTLESAAATELADTRIVTAVAVVAGDHEPPIERYLSVYVGPDRLSVGGLEDGVLRLRDVGRRYLVDRLQTMLQ